MLNVNILSITEVKKSCTQVALDTMLRLSSLNLYVNIVQCTVTYVWKNRAAGNVLKFWT